MVHHTMTMKISSAPSASRTSSHMIEILRGVPHRVGVRARTFALLGILGTLAACRSPLSMAHVPSATEALPPVATTPARPAPGGAARAAGPSLPAQPQAAVLPVPTDQGGVLVNP